MRFFLGFYKWPLIAMALLELAQAACQILIPKALQQLIDSATQLAGTGEGSVWTSFRVRSGFSYPSTSASWSSAGRVERSW